MPAFGAKAEIAETLANIRFWPKSVFWPDRHTRSLVEFRH